MNNTPANFLGRALPDPSLVFPKDHSMADTTYDRIVSSISDFQDTLSKSEEVGAQLAQFGVSLTITIENVGFRNPNLIEIHGLTPDGHRCTLLQHQSQVNILLIAMKVPENREPKRIGFRLNESP